MKKKCYKVKSLHGYNGQDSRMWRRFGDGWRNRAFTLIELLVILASVALLAAILLPALAKAREKSWRASCQSHLVILGLGFRTWEGDHDRTYPMNVPTQKGGSMEWGAGSNMFRHDQVMSNELNDPKILVCPADNRQPAIDFLRLSNTNVSYFIGLDGDETFPALPLAGDRNLMTNGVPVNPGLVAVKTNDSINWSETTHKFAGNVVLSDGSVQTVGSAGLQQLFQKSGTNVNRLAIP